MRSHFVSYEKKFIFMYAVVFIGLYIAWPIIIIIPNNWKCFKEVINKSTKKQISIIAVLAISPNYLLKG